MLAVALPHIHRAAADEIHTWERRQREEPAKLRRSTRGDQGTAGWLRA